MAHLTAHRVEGEFRKGDQGGQLVTGSHHQVGSQPLAAILALHLPAVRELGNGANRCVVLKAQQAAGLRFFQGGAGEIRRAEPAPQGVADATMAAGQADHLLNFRGREWVHQLGGEGALTHLGELGGGFLVIAKLGDAAQGEGDGMARGQGLQSLAGIAEGQGIEARQRIVLPIEQGIDRPLAVAGGAGGGLALCTQQDHLAAPFHQRQCRHGRGDAATYDQHLAVPADGTGIPGGDALLGRFALPHPCQHLPLAAVALHLLHGKAGVNQAAAHETGAGKGREGRGGSSEASETIEQRLRPHLGILGRREAIQIPGIHQTLGPVRHLGQHLLDVAKPEIEADAAAGKQQTVAAGYRQRPLVDERLA